MNCIIDFTGSPVALDAGNLTSLSALPPDDFRTTGLPWNNQGYFINRLFRFTISNRLTFYRNGQQLIERRTAETLKAGQFVPPEKSICSILISCGSKRPRILHVQPSPQLGTAKWRNCPVVFGAGSQQLRNRPGLTVSI